MKHIILMIGVKEINFQFLQEDFNSATVDLRTATSAMELNSFDNTKIMRIFILSNPTIYNKMFKSDI